MEDTSYRSRMFLVACLLYAYAMSLEEGLSHWNHVPVEVRDGLHVIIIHHYFSYFNFRNYKRGQTMFLSTDLFFFQSPEMTCEVV